MGNFTENYGVHQGRHRRGPDQSDAKSFSCHGTAVSSLSQPLSPSPVSLPFFQIPSLLSTPGAMPPSFHLLARNHRLGFYRLIFCFPKSRYSKLFFQPHMAGRDSSQRKQSPHPTGILMPANNIIKGSTSAALV